MDIKVGDYVRIRPHRDNNSPIGIIKIESLRQPINSLFIDINISPYRQCQIVESSPKTIDLIQVGDYVNGYKVIHIGFDDDKKTLLFVDWQEGINHKGGNTIKNSDIKSIVTKEQFEQMEYRIGDDK